jgi:hypothetical protein
VQLVFSPDLDAAAVAHICGLLLPRDFGSVGLVLVVEPKAGFFEQFPAFGEFAALEDVMGDLLPGPFAPGLAGGGRFQADLLHFIGPLLVVISVARWLSELRLPEVHHFVSQGRGDLAIGAVLESGGVECDFVHDLGVPAVGELVGREIAL